MLWRELAEAVELRIGRALEAAQRLVVRWRTVLDAVEEARREFENRRAIEDARVVDLGDVNVEVVALPHQAPPRRACIDVDTGRPGVERLVLHRQRVFVRGPIVAAEHVLPARPLEVLLLREEVVASHVRRVRQREQVEERPTTRVQTVRRNPVARERLAGLRVPDGNKDAGRRHRLREVAGTFERRRHLEELQILRSQYLRVVEDVEEEQLVAVGVNPLDSRDRAADGAAQI